MPLEFNSNLHPPLGFTFKEKDGTKFRGTSWVDLEAKVAGYRSANGRPVGDVRAEIMEAVCKSSPSFCRDSGKPRAPLQPRPERKPDAPRPTQYVPAGKGNIVARATNWIHALLAFKRRNAVEFVSKPEARRRAAICAQCPKQTPVAGSCGGCMTALKAAKAIILAGQAPVEKVIAGCKVLGEDTSVSVFIVQDPSGEGELPANCWRRTR